MNSKSATPFETLRKVLTFSRLAPADLSPDEQLAWRTWAGYFPHRLWSREGGTEDVPAIAELPSLIAATAGALRRCASDEEWSIADAVVWGSKSGLRFVGKTRESVFVIAVVEAVIAARHSLRKCARCGASFVVLRRGRFCSVECAQRDRAQHGREQRIVKRLMDGGLTETEAQETVTKMRAARAAKRDAREGGYAEAKKIGRRRAARMQRQGATKAKIIRVKRGGKK
jgi:hypothetical protein